MVHTCKCLRVLCVPVVCVSAAKTKSVLERALSFITNVGSPQISVGAEVADKVAAAAAGTCDTHKYIHTHTHTHTDEGAGG